MGVPIRRSSDCPCIVVNDQLECIKLVINHNYIQMHGQQNVKKMPLHLSLLRVRYQTACST